MNNDLEQFSEERLKKICAFTKGGVDVRHVEIEALARIALAAKQAKPVAEVYQPANIGICAALGPAIRMINVGLPAGTLLYTTPQPAHTEQGQMPDKALSLSETIGELRKYIDSSGGYDFEALRSEQMNSPAIPGEMAVSDEMTVTAQMFAKGHNACRNAILQSGTLSGWVPFDGQSPYDAPYKIPSNLRELIAEEIGILFSDDDAQGIWGICRAAMIKSGNSPEIPDGWIKCDDRMPDDEQECLVQTHSGYRYVSFYDEHTGLFFDSPGGNQINSIEHILVTHWMPVAAPKPESE